MWHLFKNQMNSSDLIWGQIVLSIHKSLRLRFLPIRLDLNEFEYC